MVSLESGQRNPDEMMALLTRSFASFTTTSEAPTIATVGSPGLRWVSTHSYGALMPFRHRVATRACDIRLPCRFLSLMAGIYIPRDED